MRRHILSQFDCPETSDVEIHVKSVEAPEGADASAFRLHKIVLTQSDFFAKLLRRDGGFAESGDSHVSVALHEEGWIDEDALRAFFGAFYVEDFSADEAIAGRPLEMHFLSDRVGFHRLRAHCDEAVSAAIGRRTVADVLKYCSSYGFFDTEMFVACVQWMKLFFFAEMRLTDDSWLRGLRNPAVVSEILLAPETFRGGADRDELLRTHRRLGAGPAPSPVLPHRFEYFFPATPCRRTATSRCERFPVKRFDLTGEPRLEGKRVETYLCREAGGGAPWLSFCLCTSGGRKRGDRVTCILEAVVHAITRRGTTTTSHRKCIGSDHLRVDLKGVIKKKAMRDAFSLSRRRVLVAFSVEFDLRPVPIPIPTHLYSRT